MDITNEQRGDWQIMTVHGRLDAATAPDFDKSFQTIQDVVPLKVALDLAGLEYISSAGLRSILAAGKKAHASSGKIVFAGLAGMVEEVFRVSGFTAMFEFYSSVDEAVAS